MAWGVPQLFRQMPAALVPEVRVALLAVGLSTAVALPFATFLSTFTGLQEYVFPTILATVGRSRIRRPLIILLVLHGSLVQLALVDGWVQFGSGGRTVFRLAQTREGRVDFSFLMFHRGSAIQLAKYGSVLSMWTLRCSLSAALIS